MARIPIQLSLSSWEIKLLVDAIDNAREYFNSENSEDYTELIEVCDSAIHQLNKARKGLPITKPKVDFGDFINERGN